MRTYHKVLKEAQQSLQEAQCGEQAALRLLLELSNMQAHNLYTDYDEVMPEVLYEEYITKVQRLKNNEPLAHVLGYEWFYGYAFDVNEDVLIPRPETEELVANILLHYDEQFTTQDHVILADIGTGSGAIAITLKKEEPSLNIIATDISEQAIDVARNNAKKQEAVVEFCVGDMLAPLIDRNLKVDILISNPPYIPCHEQMEASVIDFEPHIALFGGEDGLEYYRKIFKDAHKVLKERALLGFEIGYQQKEALIKEAKQYFKNAIIEIQTDMSGKDRMLFIKIGMDKE